MKERKVEGKMKGIRKKIIPLCESTRREKRLDGSLQIRGRIERERRECVRDRSDQTSSREVRDHVYSVSPSTDGRDDGIFEGKGKEQNQQALS